MKFGTAMRELYDLFQSRWARLLLVPVLATWLILLWPFRRGISRLWGSRPSVALEKDVRELWERDPEAGLDLLRSASEHALRGDEFPPYGKFRRWDEARVLILLYESERLLGNHGRALDLVDSVWNPSITLYYLNKADCLLALGRRDEAIATLLRGLQFDKRNKVRDKLVSVRCEVDPVFRTTR
jgi:hypothetical protein